MSSSYQRGDLVTFERVPQGVAERTLIITAAVVEDGMTEHGNVKVEYANPLPWMNGVKQNDGVADGFHFGDTVSHVEPHKILSHYRPETNEVLT